MASNDCWDAFGSDSDSDNNDDDGNHNHNVDHNTSAEHSAKHHPFEPAADATALSITQHFVALTKSTGILLKDRVVAIDINSCSNDGTGDNVNVERWKEMMTERIVGRGMKIVECSGTNGGEFQCDAAVIMAKEEEDGLSSSSSHIKRALLPGGVLWIMIYQEEGGASMYNNDGSNIHKRLKGVYSEAIWDIDSASIVFSSSTSCQVICIQKRSCVINAWSCPWMDKQQRIPSHIASSLDENDFTIHNNETYLGYERKVASAVTISPSVAERTRKKITTSSNEPVYATVLTDANIQRATEILQKHGFLVIKGLLSPTQTIPWGHAVLDDFESAVERLRCHPTRPVDLMNPTATNEANLSKGGGGGDGGERVFEPLSYKEMAMREDLRVDLRSGPKMETLRKMQNELAIRSMAQEGTTAGSSLSGDGLNDGPSMIQADILGTVKSWRFHPSILAIIKSLFNPRDASLYKGNFGRWNFGGAGPDGSPQPFRLGQIGSVLSCPGSADQAIHADTPHLFEHVDCLACHYCNVFTPGYEVRNDDSNNSIFYKNEFDGDWIWTGNSTIGGTALVHGSHKLSVTAKLLSDDDDDADAMDDDIKENGSASLRRQLLQLHTLRPALEAGDVLIFDCRTIHYGLANTSQGSGSADGNNINAGRRPMLYLNVSQSWFHDPKNWDNRERIFD